MTSRIKFLGSVEKLNYALLWLATGGLFVSFMVLPDLLYWLACLLHLHYLTLLVLICFAFLLAVAMHFSLVHSRQVEKMKNLAHRVALFELKLRQQLDVKKDEENQ